MREAIESFIVDGLGKETVAPEDAGLASTDIEYNQRNVVAIIGVTVADTTTEPSHPVTCGVMCRTAAESHVPPEQ